MIQFDQQQQQTLLTIAQQSIAHGLTTDKALVLDPLQYSEPLCNTLASFVTLTINKQLRGCIGSLEAGRALVCDVAENAYASAFCDPRFKRLTAQEQSLIHIHISVLTTPEDFPVSDEADLLEQLQPYVDGLILYAEGRRATFLPAVWESLPEAGSFVEQLKRKAGLKPDYWSETIQFKRYQAISIE